MLGFVILLGAVFVAGMLSILVANRVLRRHDRNQWNSARVQQGLEMANQAVVPMPLAPTHGRPDFYAPPWGGL